MTKKNIIFFAAFLVLTNLLTFGLTNLISIRIDNKMIVPTEDYEMMLESYNENAKIYSIKKYIEENYLRDVDESKMMDGELKGMVSSLGDPYSAYLTVDEYKSFTEETSGVYAGIGIIVTPNEDNYIEVVSPIEDTPGFRAGIKTGDIITKVNGVEYYGETMHDAVKQMKGEANTEVTLTILRDGRSTDIKIVREIIKLQTVKSAVIDDNIGYIRITSFDEPTADDFISNLKSLEKKDIKGLIIDLRNNPGGLLNVCAKIADELLGEGDIVYTETKQGKREYLRSEKSMINIPLVVLVNGGSASASEILAGAISDHDRGELIGTTTFGKGVVQSIRELPDKTGIKLTVSEYFTPNGTNIHGIGITPDIVVELDENAQGMGVDYLKEDNQLQRALDEIKSEIE